MEIKKVGIVGCGIMGRGITEVTAKAGYDTVVSEINKELLDKGLAAINTSLTVAVRREKMTEAEKEATLSHIKGTVNMGDFKDCDMVVEAAVENLELKKKIFSELDKVCRKDAILATNTSCLSVMDIAAVTQRQDKVLGMHYMNPVPVMKLLELVKTIMTSDETLSTAKAFGESCGKTVVTAKDTPGFIVNRLMIPFLLEAVRMLESGIATKEDIDKAIVLGLNHPMGPFTLSDLVGLDTASFICDAMYEDTKNPLFASPILLKKMVTAGHHGRKTSKGFYDYNKT
jgi:3-hydroxybutyryl-CoA dehydrogenase